MTRSERRAFWHEHVEAWQDGDESQAAYCRRHGLSAMSFSHWKRRFERDQLASAVGSGAASASLIEVQVADKDQPVASAGVTVEVGGQVRLQLARDFDANALQRAVRALTDARG